LFCLQNNTQSVIPLKTPPPTGRVRDFSQRRSQGEPGSNQRILAEKNGDTFLLFSAKPNGFAKN
jgi:hypothetical protein